MIESFNLRSVEDDINGKVFEAFLEASVRGKELGQFFTPRSVVKFMTKLAGLRITKDSDTDKYRPDSVLDGSCGTGGFLIFALSDLFYKADEKNLTSDELSELKKRIRANSLFGIDASEDDIVPITRMNMYLHGDGGSHIFLADTLDKELFTEPGTDIEHKSELQELKKLLARMPFDVVLTNPPFSMKYEHSKPDEKRILEQYALASLGGNLAKSLKSNIMFIERYHDILKPGGKLLTVIDESVLNTEGQGKVMQKFRRWLRDRFIVRAIVSLPKNAFVNADAGVKTSVLYLTKKSSPDERRPKVFMAISNDIGHNDAGRITSEWGDLKSILDFFKNFEDGNYN
jgi:type I restriction enzyme M protein